MIEAFTAAAVRAAEEPLLARERGFPGGLMHHAATALATTVARRLTERRGRVTGSTVVALVGPGNNGGDALHALAGLARRGARTVAVLTTPAAHDGGLAALRSCGGTVLALVPEAPGQRVWTGEALAEALGADVVLDGLLGIGARGALRGTAAQVVTILAELLEQIDDGAPAGVVARPLVVAVDVPSGIGVDDGTLPGPVLPADVTVTFGAPKAGLVLPPAAGLVGELETVDLGLGPVLADQGHGPVVTRLGPADAASLWPVPGPRTHKYSRGVVGVVAGTDTYPGAAVLTVAGAQGAGCGMVRYVGPESVRHAVLAAHPEVIAAGTADVRVQAWVVGPGVDTGDDAQVGRARRAIADGIAQRLPVVVDAGGLELLPERVPPRVVLTPHAGELARLLVRYDVRVDRETVEAEPLRWAREAHERTGGTVLLKGGVTIVVGPAGAWSQADAPGWLATAGAGDVLAGALGALLAGGTAGDGAHDPGGDGAHDAARLAALAALVHGRAAHRANPGGPVTAGEVARALPATVADLLR